MKQCIQCNAEIQDHVMYCPECDAKQFTDEQPQTKAVKKEPGFFSAGVAFFGFFGLIMLMESFLGAMAFFASAVLMAPKVWAKVIEKNPKLSKRGAKFIIGFFAFMGSGMIIGMTAEQDTVKAQKEASQPAKQKSAPKTVVVSRPSKKKEPKPTVVPAQKPTAKPKPAKKSYPKLPELTLYEWKRADDNSKELTVMASIALYESNKDQFTYSNPGSQAGKQKQYKTMIKCVDELALEQDSELKETPVTYSLLACAISEGVIEGFNFE